jgi:hypothetical protein
MHIRITAAVMRIVMITVSSYLFDFHVPLLYKTKISSIGKEIIYVIFEKSHALHSI